VQSLSRTDQELMFHVVTAYESVLASKRDSQVAQHALLTAKTVLDLSRSRVLAGTVAESDALAGEVNIATRQAEVIRAHGEESIAQAELSNAMGLPAQLGKVRSRSCNPRFSSSLLWRQRSPRPNRTGRTSEPSVSRQRRNRRRSGEQDLPLDHGSIPLAPGNWTNPRLLEAEVIAGRLAPNCESMSCRQPSANSSHSKKSDWSVFMRDKSLLRTQSA